MLKETALSVESHETLFAPWPAEKQREKLSKNFLFWEQFMEKILHVNEILLDFHFDSFSGEKGQVSCKIAVNKALLAHLSQKGWSCQVCKEIK